MELIGREFEVRKARKENEGGQGQVQGREGEVETGHIPGRPVQVVVGREAKGDVDIPSMGIY